MSPQTGTASCAPQLLQPRSTDRIRAPSHPIPKLSQDLGALCLPGSLRMNCVGSRKHGFFLTSNAFPGNHPVHVSGGVCTGWDTGQGATRSFSPWIRARSSCFAAGMGKSSGTELIPLLCPPAPLASTVQVSPNPPRWLPNNRRTNPSAPGSHLAPLC